MIDLTKPVYCGGEEVNVEISMSQGYISEIDTHRWWYRDGTRPNTIYPPLTNEPRKEFQEMMDALHEIDQPADQKQVVKVAILGPGEPPLSYYASLHSELRIAKANAEADSTRIAALEGMVGELDAKLQQWLDGYDHPGWWREEMGQLLTRAKNLLNEQR